jgi:dienelactone hydrolase
MSPNDSGDDRALRRRSVLQTLGAVGAVGAFTGQATARNCNGPSDGVSPPPGPPVLYREPASAPQFENAGPWDAAPLRVSGHDAYVDGEYLFQDFIYDDNGANTSPAGDAPNPAPASHLFGPMSGDLVYPTDAGRGKAAKKYVNNAADLLEFRARLTDDGRVHYRFTLTTMREPDVAAIAVGVDTDPDEAGGSRDLGYGLGELGIDPDHLLVIWGTGAELDGDPLPDDAVSVAPERNQIDVVLPSELAPEADPSMPAVGATPDGRPNRSGDGETWRHHLVTGLWDDAAEGFKQVADQPTADQPGGARGQDPPPVFNVGLRYAEQEPVATPNADPGTIERQLDEAAEEATASRGVGYGHWRDHAQSKALADRDVSRFHADVDFGRLAARETTYNVPETGYRNRIYASHSTVEDSDNPPAGIGLYVTEDGDDNNGEDVIRGNLVPYSLYVPESYDGDPASLHIHLHSLSGTYNQYRSFTPNFIRQVGEERDKLVLTTTGRGPGVPYDDQAELDVFEAWADTADAFAVDADRVTLGGYSMGGIGTHRLASKYPDLFAKGYSIVGSLGGEFSDEVGGDDLYKNQERIAINQRHVPLLIWQGPADELAPLPLVLKYVQTLRDLGLRHRFEFFPAADHLSFGYLDEWGPAAEFLDGATVERAPPRITYRRVPGLDNDEFDLVHDGAYWVSDIELAETGAEAGLVDVRSLGFGDPEPIVTKPDGTGTDPKPHIERSVEWKRPLQSPAPRNALVLSLEDVSALTVWVDEAALDATRDLDLAVDTTTRTTVRLVSEHGTAEVTLPPGEGQQRTVRLCDEGRDPGTPGRGAAGSSRTGR